MKVTIVGVGGVGSWIAEFLTRAGVERITLVDGDTVEKKNLAYANYISEDMAWNKAFALVSRLVRATGENQRDRHLDCSQRFINRFSKRNVGDITILCVDSISARIQLISDLMQKDKRWVDCRAEGRYYQIFTHKSKLIDEFLTSKAPNQRRTCQPRIEEIEAGNLVCASVATQIVLDMMRGKEYPSEVMSW